MSSAAVPVEIIPGIAKAIPGSGENRSPSRRNHCSPSARNRVRLHPGTLFAFTPESRSSSPGIRRKQEPAPWRFLYAIDNRNGTVPPPGVPGGDAVGIIEYRNNSGPALLERREIRRKQNPAPQQDPRLAAGEDHANTARQLRSVWVAVPDASAAVKQSVSLGFAVIGKTQSSALGAVGRQVACGRGSIEFWEPASRNGQLALLLRRNGPGPFGYSVGVADLGGAHDIAQEGFQTKLAIEDQSDRKSVTVSGGLTGGVWVEFVQL